MCELLGLSALRETRLTFSLEVFARHGGLEDHHRDGWGVAFFDPPDAFVCREPRPAAHSPTVRFLEHHGPASRTVISHIRRATRGDVRLPNTHPFVRELGGRIHVFAHNGAVPGVTERPLSGRFRPVGETDSEHAFCLLLDRLAPLWDAGVPGEAARVEVLRAFCAEMAALGPFNMLYGDGELLFAHAHRRRQRDGRIGPPGLWLLQRHCVEPSARTEAAGLGVHGGSQELVLLASVPLSDEDWRPLSEGALVVCRDGRARVIGSDDGGGHGR